MSPRTADAIRKACAYALAIALTILMFRILSRLAEGHEHLTDIELWLALALFGLGILWVKAARRVGHRARLEVMPSQAEGAPPSQPPSGPNSAT